jgi:RNA-binding protein YhbY
MNEFYEYLRRKGISARNVFPKLASWSPKEIRDFIFEAYLLLEDKHERAKSVFTFYANSTLSGIPFQCISPECRLKSVDSLGRFAALYADKVYIENPLERYFSRVSPDSLDISLVGGDILTLLYLRPLFKAGVLGIRNNIACLCEECLAKQEAVEEEVLNQLEKPRRQLRRRYLAEVQAHVVEMQGQTFFRLEGSEDLIQHTAVDLQTKEPEGMPTRIRPGHKLSRQQIVKYGLIDPWINRVIRDLFIQNVDVDRRGCQYLTDRQVDLDIVTSVGEPETIRMCKAFLDGLSHSVPAVEGVRLEKLVRLRQKEGEAFLVYRDALHKTLVRAPSLGPKEMRQLIDDEVRPEIHKIERTVKSARRLLAESLTRDIVVSTAFVGIGLFSGVLSPQAAVIVAALGGANFAKSMAERGSQLIQDPVAVTDKPYYFMWKLKKLGAR